MRQQSTITFGTVFVLAGVALGSPALAVDARYLPPYMSQTEYLLGPPGVSGEAASGLVNPAAWRMLPGGEAQFFWTEPEDGVFAPQTWSLAFGEGLFGFGVSHHTWKPEMMALAEGYAGNPPGKRTMTDYTLALSTGDKRSAAGLAVHWTTGEGYGRRDDDKAVSIGSIWRPIKQFSLGTAAAFTFKEREQRYIVDGGLRPFGSSLLTLFGDVAFLNDEDIEDAAWSIGAASEILPGVTVMGRTREDDTYSLGFSISLGAFGLSTHPHYDDEGDLRSTSYGVRVGYRKPSLMGMGLEGRGKNYLALNMKGSTRYRRYRLFDDEGHTLTELLGDLEEVRTNDAYGGVVLNLSAMQTSMALRWELREKLGDIRNAGKRVVVYIDNVDISGYYLASVADRVVMDPEGAMLLIGLGMSRTYMKNMAEKVGLGVDEWRFFAYKSAAEVLSREEMSEPDREQRQALLDGFYEEMRADISESRGLDPGSFDKIVNDRVFALADTAKALGLVDDLARWEDIRDVIKDLEGGSRRLTGPAHMAFLETHEDRWGRRPRIAVIYGLGACAMDEGIAARRLGGVIRAARENSDIKAVVFRADSPGGEIIPSDIVALELKKTSEEKPVIVSQGWVAGSGGYWISMYGDKILATPFTITGSIGVIGLWFWNDGLGDKLGLTSDGVTVGDHADLLLGIRLPLLGAMVPDRNLTPFERKRVEEEIRRMYDRFLVKVAEGRNMTKEDVHEVGQGRVWTGRDGLEIGLVDEIGGLEEAVALAKEAAGIPEDADVELVELPRMGLFNPNLFKMASPIRLAEESPEIEYMKMILRSGGRPLAVVPPDLLIGP